jgi:hypothetical protein
MTAIAAAVTALRRNCRPRASAMTPAATSGVLGGHATGTGVADRTIGASITSVIELVKGDSTRCCFARSATPAALPPGRYGKSDADRAEACFPLIASVTQSEIGERPPSARDGYLGHSSRRLASRRWAVRRAKRERHSGAPRRPAVPPPVSVWIRSAISLRDAAVLAALRAV